MNNSDVHTGCPSGPKSLKQHDGCVTASACMCLVNMFPLSTKDESRKCVPEKQSIYVPFMSP